MLAAPSHPPAHAFFLDIAPGQRFCLYHRPHGPVRGLVLQAPAFAEEMNKSRRMAALQARMLAAEGYGVLQIDLYGCGDSSGDSGDARWEIWRNDLLAALAWLRRQAGAPASPIPPVPPVYLWGLRLGALLALDVVRDAGALAGMLLWQPVTDGAAYLTQFLRLRLAADMLTAGAGPEGGTEGLRRSLAGGASLEIAGYALAPELAAAIDALDMRHIAPPGCPVHWFEVLAQAGRQVAPGRARLARHHASAGWHLHTHVVEGPPFWSSQEIMEAPALLTATAAALRAGDA